jgi:cell wall-associated NlpC family hydrolase
MSDEYDPRLTPARPDLAAEHLRGKVDAKKFVPGIAHQICMPVAPLTFAPKPDQELQQELLFGEGFIVYEQLENWVWGQAERDDFVGFLPRTHVQPGRTEPDHWVSALRTPLYKWPDLKAATAGYLHRNSLIKIQGQDDHYVDTGAGWVHVGDVRPLGDPMDDFVEVALSYLHVPYVWGGRSSFGLDCSALVQNALQAIGQDCLRDAYMQEAVLGEALALEDVPGKLQRGDLIYWKGHVGMMIDCELFLHANAHHMACAVEPVQDTIKRIQKTAGPIISVRRLL